MAPKRVLFPRGLCFSVVGDGGGRAVLTAANCHCSSKAPAPGSWGREASFGLSHVKEALGQEAGRQGYSLETGRTWGATGGRWESAHRGIGKLLSVCPHWRLPSQRSSSGLLWASAPDPSGLHSAPSHPSALRRPTQGWSEDTGSQWESVCGADREGAEWGGMAPAEGGLQLFSKRDRRSSLLLLGRSGGSRYERSSSGFVSSGRRSSEGSGMSDAPCAPA